MVIRSARLLFVGGVLGVAAQAAAQAGYPQQQPQPQYQQPAPVQPVPQYQQPAPAAQPQYQQPAPAAQPQYQPAPQPAPGTYPQPQPAPFGAQPAPAPAPGYPPPPDQQQQYSGFPVPPPDTMQPPPGGIPDGAFQLGLFTTLIGYQPASVSFENNGPEFSISNLTWGIGSKSNVGLELGYGLSEMIVFGGTLALGGSSSSQEQEGGGGGESDSSEFAFEFGPKLDLMFSPGSKVMPFVGAQVLVSLDSQDFGGGSESSSTLFIFGARGGLRAFLTDSFSIDPAIFFGGGFGSGSQNGGGGAADADYDASGFRVGLTLGFSGWMI